MKISDVMTKNPILISKETTVLEAAKRMKESNCGILPIANEEEVCGVVTDRDIVVQAVAEGENLENKPVKEIMTEDICFCNEDDPLDKAVHTMNDKKVRRILVLNENKDLTGILSLADVINRVEDKSTLASLFQQTTVA